jgi:hypothetical protein
MRPHDVLGAAGQNVIAANHLFDLALRTSAVIDEHPLPLAQRSHGRFPLENLRSRRNGSGGRKNPDAENENYLALAHNIDSRMMVTRLA